MSYLETFPVFAILKPINANYYLKHMNLTFAPFFVLKKARQTANVYNILSLLISVEQEDTYFLVSNLIKFVAVWPSKK